MYRGIRDTGHYSGDPEHLPDTPSPNHPDGTHGKLATRTWDANLGLQAPVSPAAPQP